MCYSNGAIISQYALAIKRHFPLIEDAKKTCKLTYMDGQEFERRLVELFVEISKSHGVKAKPLAERAWPRTKDAGTKWRKIRNGAEPRGLSVRDAFDLASALGVGLTEMCGIVQGRALTIQAAKPAEKTGERKQ